MEGRKEGGEGREGRVRDGKEEERGERWHGRGRRRGKGREERVRRYIRRGQLKEWECIDMEVRGR